MHKEFENFILFIKKERDKFTIIQKYEIGLSVLLVRLGFKMGWFLQSSDFANLALDTPLRHPLTLIKNYHFPFLKIQAFTINQLSLKEFKDLFSCLVCDKSIVVKHLTRTRKKITLARYSKFSFGGAFVRFYGEYSGVSDKYHLILRLFGKKIFCISFPLSKSYLYLDSQSIYRVIKVKI